MKFKRSLLEKLIKEELMTHLGSLLEADKQDADASNKEKDSKKQQKDKVKKPDSGSVEEPADKKPEVPDVVDPADDDLEADADDPDKEDEERSSGKISKELTGKTVQSVTLEPKSQLVPGAQELVLTFNEITDPLRVIVTKTGAVKFFFRGLHDSL